MDESYVQHGWCYVVAPARGIGYLILFIPGHTSHETDDSPCLYI